MNQTLKAQDLRVPMHDEIDIDDAGTIEYVDVLSYPELLDLDFNDVVLSTDDIRWD